MIRKIYGAMLALMIGAPLALAQQVPAPPGVKIVHAAWAIKPPGTIDRFFDMLQRTVRLERDFFMGDDGVEVDLFTAPYWGDEGFYIRNENEHTADITMTECRFVKVPGTKDQLRRATHNLPMYDTAIAMDAPNVIHVTLPPYNFAKATLTVPGPYRILLSDKSIEPVDCKIAVTHPPQSAEGP